MSSLPAVRARPESVPVAAALAGVGGFLDAYTFLAHGGVFANAQTGNVVLLAIELARGQLALAARHLWPLLAFVVGVLTVEALVRLRSRPLLRRTPRVVLVVEALTLVVVGALPASTPDVVSTVAIAWAATLQVATFRSVAGIAYNTTFTTGNLRTLTSAVVGWLHEHDSTARREATALGAVVACFAMGAVVGGLLTTSRVGDRAVWAAAAVLPVVLWAIARQTRRLEQA